MIKKTVFMHHQPITCQRMDSMRKEHYMRGVLHVREEDNH
ncbi:UNVERIFIED_ORG: hypothetical protein ABRZ91_003154 [Heyndrickxia coagulans]